MKKTINSSGTFWLDERGVLQDFCCAPENNADVCAPENTRKLYTLQIPEGVTGLKAMAFRYYTVLEQLTLPGSLEFMEACVLANCNLPEVVIPGSLQVLGDFAFGASRLRALWLPESPVWEYGRQFKESTIGTLFLSRKFRDESCNPGWRSPILGLGYLHSLRVNNVRIQEIRWLDDQTAPNPG